MRADGMKFNRRETLTVLVPAICASVLARPRSVLAATEFVTPEQFGALGDGRTNDTAAFVAMTAHVNAMGGGEIRLSHRTYVVGQQGKIAKKGYFAAPGPIMDFIACRLPLTIRGNHARLVADSALRFGTFDPATGMPTTHKQPYTGLGEIAAPYNQMILVKDCSGPVTISDLELDGNSARLVIGGPWGNTGWQLGGSGLILRDNHGPIAVRNLRSHHQPKDGAVGDGLGLPEVDERVSFTDCVFTDNGRNGFSLVGGNGWGFTRCRFDRSARNLAFRGSAPRAGIDLESERKRPIQAIRFRDCGASDNLQVAVLIATKRVSDVVWIGGKIVGTSAWTYFGSGGDRVRFRDVLFAGALVNLSGETFENCTFTDDPSAGVSGKLYNPSGRFLANLGKANRFIACTFIHARPEASRNGRVDDGLFENCTFITKRGAGPLVIAGHFRGSRTRFVTEAGGSDFPLLPTGTGKGKTLGAAEQSYQVTDSRGRTRTYPPSH
ncbi:MAG: hypothetical protein ABIR63_05275 [Sphingomicrobium sp.]